MPDFEVQGEMFDAALPIHKKFLPTVRNISNDNAIVNEWDVPHTIKELSYLVHSHYRYYGKFPSVVAGQILDSVPVPSKEHYMIDNFCGSGTSLVEAKLRGIKSYGIDISWLAVLASNVKVRHVELKEVERLLSEIAINFDSSKDDFTSPEDKFCSKWFNDEAARDLLVIQGLIYEIPASDVRDFLVVAFIGIVRRVSKAFDGEVRPHINKEKSQRSVMPAFAKKVRDMCKDHQDFMSMTNGLTTSKCLLSSNLRLPKAFNDGKCYLAISHPPYLNSFNYTPVFSLEFYWGKKFEPQYAKDDVGIYKNEMRAHPADEKLTEGYFNHLKGCYSETYRIQEDGAHLAIVIGDCTRLGKVVPVLDQTISIVEGIGYKLKEINHRTTHYGLGKYAYSHRADYHGDSATKKDGVLIFTK